MQLPRRMIDLSSPLDNDTILDHPFMRPKIEYRSNAENAPMLGFVRHLGFSLRRMPEEPDVIEARLTL